MPSNHAPAGLLARLTRASAGASARRPKTVIVLWLILVAGFVTAGALTGTKSLTGADAGGGELQPPTRRPPRATSPSAPGSCPRSRASALIWRATAAAPSSYR